MKAEQYREMSVEELVDMQDEFRRKLFEMRSQSVTETLENSKSICNTRREIARILTIIQEKENKQLKKD